MHQLIYNTCAVQRSLTSPEIFLFSAEIWATCTISLSFSSLLYSAPSSLALIDSRETWWFCSLIDFYFLTWSTLLRCSWTLATFSASACYLLCSAMVKLESICPLFSRAACSRVCFLSKTLLTFSSEF